MRRRRPKRLRTRVDKDATVAMHFKDRESYVALDGRHVYRGLDAERIRLEAYVEWHKSGRLCHRCGKALPSWMVPEWEHLKSKGRNLRDDHPRNRAFSHQACHRKAHNREPRWSKQEVASIAGGLNTCA